MNHYTDFCTYCGDYYELTKDHVIPVSYTHNKRQIRGTYCVTACMECNCTLGDKMLINVHTRADFLIAAYKHKYKRLLKQPYWTEDELSEMSPDFQRYIRAKQRDRHTLQKRMDHLALVATLGTDVASITELKQMVHEYLNPSCVAAPVNPKKLPQV